MATNNLLTQQAPDYRSFVDNQVLTDQQLNAVVDHLNYQDQLSRVLLSGVGIVCGLRITYDGDNNLISLTEGAAVTTAGNLLKTGPATFRGFKKFADPNVKYRFFTDEDDNVYDLWELEQDTAPSDVHELNQLGAITEMEPGEAVALLYLEDYLEEEEDCSPVDCDTQGRQVVNNLRVLLVSEETAGLIAEGDSIFSGIMESGNDPAGQKLPKMYTDRVVLNSVNTKSFSAFRKAYTVQFETLATRIAEAGTLTFFKSIYERLGIDPESRLGNLSQGTYNVQYLYDFYKDLVTAYNEFRDLLKENYSLCCPDPGAFPKHILLGKLSEEEKSWRHRFYPSPILDEMDVARRLRKAFTRMLLMIDHFNADQKQEIRITPSVGADQKLGFRAVPHYYDLEDAGDAASFLSNWKEGDLELVPNYFEKSYPSGNFNPLDVCLEGHDFFRIEGHVGKNVRDAQDNIQEIRDQKGLAFDVKPVAIGAQPDEDLIDYDRYRVYFEDLQVILQAWNEEQKCMLETASKFLTQFSLEDPGRHIKFSPSLDMNATVNTADGNDNTAADDTGSDTSGDNQTVFGTYMAEMEPMYVMSYATGTVSKAKASKENEVYQNIDTTQGTTGYTLNQNIAVTDGRNDIIYNGSKALEQVVGGWENKEIVEATVNIPLELIAYLKETQDYKLTDIEDFNQENLEKYIEALRAQCRQTQQSKKRFQNLSSLKTEEKAQPWLEQYQYILNRIISSCCLIEKVTVLYQKIIERKKELLEDFVLKNFVGDHPGAEHKAGVPDGGTFILLYYAKPKVQAQLAGGSTGMVEGQ
ncbi:MAG: hypothetical protein R3281_00005, partial [Balneolaceae bacterium]|nr:hypothetical protein [Balneolaceae bacterium]